MVLNPLRSLVSDHFLLGVSLDRVKQQLRILDDDDDALLIQYIEAATSYAEEWMGRFVLPAKVLSFFNSCCSCSHKNFRLNRRVFNSVIFVEVLQTEPIPGYTSLSNDQFKVTKETWETFVCITDDVEIDCTVENGCQTNPETVLIQYQTGEVITLPISTITSVSGTPNIATVDLVTLDHGLKTGDVVVQQNTGASAYNGAFGVTVISSTAYTFTYEGPVAGAAVTGDLLVTQIPPQIQLAIMQMVARMYENRGDCCDECGEVPCSAQKKLKQFKRYNIRGAGANDCCCR